MKRLMLFCAIFCAVIFSVSCAYCDIVELKDGTVLKDCFVKDEGIRLIVWESLEKVGTPDYKVIPRSQLAPILSKRYTRLVEGKTVDLPQNNPCVDRGPEWDVHPQLPDLSVTFIEMNPKLAGLHGLVPYDDFGAPTIGGAPIIDKRVKELGEEKKYLDPEYLVQDLKLKYNVGEEITFTAHVKNLGFADSKPFKYRLFVDDKEKANGSYDKAIKELGEATFEFKYKWQDGRHTIGFEIVTDQKEIATINNKVTDAMWAFSYFYVVSPKRAAYWHQTRTACGMFSFEDYYRWHLDIMNLLFENSKYPAAPEGIIARVRLDRIVYLDEVNSDTSHKAVTAPDGIGYHQGGWSWTDSDEEMKTGKFAKDGRNETEWSLPHELGHQLGLIDYYGFDYGGSDDHKWPDSNEKVTHFHNHPDTMMHSHGPNMWNELDAVYFNRTWNKPRGYFGDYLFAIPDENYLRIVDINGKPLKNAKVECFQRGTVVDPAGKPVTEKGVTWYPVIEDGDFDKPCSKSPVIVGNTDMDGMMHLPNRPASEVITLNGYHRKPNPWGNINVVGARALMLVKVTSETSYDKKPSYFYLEAVDAAIAWHAGQKEKFVVTLQTPYASVNSPNPPQNVKWQYTDNTRKLVKITWNQAPAQERHYLQMPIGYQVYRRVGDMGLNDTPWTAVATANPNPNAKDSTFEVVIDLDKTGIDYMMWFTKTQRFGVTTLATLGVQSELAQAADMNPKPSQQ